MHDELLLEDVLRGSAVAKDMNFGTCDREECTFSNACVWWVIGEVSGDDGGVRVVMLGADLAAKSLADVKKDICDPRLRLPEEDSNRVSVTISSEDAQEIRERPLLLLLLGL